jgi:hypothetical protein
MALPSTTLYPSDLLLPCSADSDATRFDYLHLTSATIDLKMASLTVNTSVEFYGGNERLSE